MENIAFRIWQILYTIVFRVENNTQLIPLGILFSRKIQNYRKFADFARLYFPYFRTFHNQTLQFTKFRMLFQDVVIFFPISIFFKISSRRLKVHCENCIMYEFWRWRTPGRSTRRKILEAQEKSTARTLSRETPYQNWLQVFQSWKHNALTARMGPRANTQQKYLSVFDRCFDMLLKNDSVSTYQVKTKKVKNLS